MFSYTKVYLYLQVQNIFCITTEQYLKLTKKKFILLLLKFYLEYF